MTQSQQIFQAKKKRKKKLTALSNKQMARPKSRASPKMNVICFNVSHMQGQLQLTMPARSSFMTITNVTFALINISTAKMKRIQDRPGSPVDCELVGLSHHFRCDSNSNKACPDMHGCPDEVHPGMRTCPNDTSHNISAVLDNMGCSLDNKWARGRHSKWY